jgi:lipase chaperone LimK
MRTNGFIDRLFDSKLGLGIVGAIAVAIAVRAGGYRERPQAGEEAAPAPAAQWDGAIGPGMLSGPLRDMPASALEAQTMRDTKIAVDAAGHLVPDRALRSLMDEFLVNGKQSERQAMEAQLRVFLRGRLSQPAAGEADRLVTDYLAYMNMEQQMLSRERFTQPDPSGLTDDQIKHLLAWQQQRAGLRQRMLGTAAASAWFDAEDGDCANALNDWQKQMAPADDDDSNEQFARRRYGQRLEEGRNNNAQACAAQIAGSIAQRR